MIKFNSYTLCNTQRFLMKSSKKLCNEKKVTSNNSKSDNETHIIQGKTISTSKNFFQFEFHGNINSQFETFNLETIFFLKFLDRKNQSTFETISVITNLTSVQK